jgi:phospholipid/cholesterol/gamma-HCH transport system ATP-binding protein
MNDNIVEIKHLKTVLSGQEVHRDVNLTIKKKDIAVIIGGSGSGKTTILRTILMLQEPAAGEVIVLGKNVVGASEEDKQFVRNNLGMLFQQSALFSGMSVLENIMFPILRQTHLPKSFALEIAKLKLQLVGLKLSDGNKLPSELSGGMLKRAAAARALALDPDLLLLDEPLSGLDPKSGQMFDELLLFLRDHLNLTILMVSHDVKSLERVSDKIFFIGEGEVLAAGPFAEVKANPHQMIQDYFAN